MTNIVFLTVLLIALCGMQCIHAKSAKGKSLLVCVFSIIQFLDAYKSFRITDSTIYFPTPQNVDHAAHADGPTICAYISRRSTYLKLKGKRDSV